MQWRGRPALRLSNGIVDQVALQGGGHIAEFCFTGDASKPWTNVLWECPWEGAAPDTAKARRLAASYGPKGVGEFLASYTGHALCLDYFGMPSAEEVRQGLPLHGEAGCANWQVIRRVTRAAARADWRVDLASAGLRFERGIELRKGESVAVFRESVSNQRDADHYFHWVQHVTFGPPFLDAQCSRVFLSGTRGKTWPLGYEKKSLVSADREFRWPLAPRETGGGAADLSIPFRERGKGFVVSVLLDPGREMQYVAALNWRLGLVAGYVFCRKDFPWVVVWEENCVREYPPWKGKTQARGIEFGTTPMPIGKEATFQAGKLFDTPGWARIPARGRQNAVYAAFLAEVPKSWRSIRDIQIAKNGLVIRGRGANDKVTIAAGGLSDLQK